MATSLLLIKKISFVCCRLGSVSQLPFLDLLEQTSHDGLVLVLVFLAFHPSLLHREIYRPTNFTTALTGFAILDTVSSAERSRHSRNNNDSDTCNLHSSSASLCSTRSQQLPEHKARLGVHNSSRTTTQPALCGAAAADVQPTTPTTAAIQPKSKILKC